MDDVVREVDTESSLCLYIYLLSKGISTFNFYQIRKQNKSIKVNMLKARNLTKSFGQHYAVNSIDLTIASDEARLTFIPKVNCNRDRIKSPIVFPA